jgi:formate C-acetyltransferase
VYSEQRSHGFAGNNSGCSFTVGGVKADGSCAVNELSYLVLEAERAVNMGSDDVVVRVAPNTPEDFLHLACQVARDVGGKLKFLGDQTAIANLMRDGMTEEQANDYAIVGCTSPTVGGLSYHVPGGIISLPGILELALNNGVHRVSGLQLGAKTGDAKDFTSYDQLWEAFCTQVRTVIPHCHNIKNADKAMFSAYMPSPFQSSLFPVCVERGMDVIDGGTAPFYAFAMSLAGAPNTGDALAALKKYVFEEKLITMEQVCQALEANFQGYEDLQKLLIRAPKFGNNDPYVDRIVNGVLSFVSDEIAKIPGFHAAASPVAAAAVTANIGLGMVLGATPDGRKAGEPISEGGISPAQGRNSTGATATMLSVAGLDHSKLRHGEVLNMRIDPKAVSSDTKLAKFQALIRSYLNAGGFLVQFNIVSTDTLRDAQIHPEAHRDLVVRVATYAAYFVELGAELQNDIIRRLEFTEC